MILVDDDKCTGCGDCLEVCPQEGAIILQAAKAAISHDRCIRCAACLTVCSEGAIYEMEAVPMVAEHGQPAQVTKQSSLSRAWPAVVATLTAVTPLAVDALAGPVAKWLRATSLAHRASDRPAPSPGDCQRRRRGRRWHREGGAKCPLVTGEPGGRAFLAVGVEHGALPGAAS